MIKKLLRGLFAKKETRHSVTEIQITGTIRPDTKATIETFDCRMNEKAIINAIRRARLNGEL